VPDLVAQHAGAVSIHAVRRRPVLVATAALLVAPTLVQAQVATRAFPVAFDGAFHAMTTAHAQAFLVLADPLTFFHRRRLADLAIEHRLPMMGSLPEFAEAGSLLSYWADATDASHRTASYVDRILKGAKAADLPIEQPTKFELVANLKTANTLAIAIPQSVLLRANRLIE
jgi:putative ABC transport system substrate-binding protein